ncbi:MAG: hypothetical protein EOP55_05010 [Sphingobacteriales bacterium]|nr:MAG: hypothetical protein EOP55_05010 [Sphingobacteriales bacterium]
MKWNRYSAEKEAIRYQKEVCDTIKTVLEPMQISLSGFKANELKEIRFYLQKGKLLTKDTVIKLNINPEYTAQDINLPFKTISVDDKIIVKAGNRYFTLAGIGYYAYYNYGMFGPVGGCHCGLSKFETINGKANYSGLLVKEQGMLNYQLPPW